MGAGVFWDSRLAGGKNGSVASLTAVSGEMRGNCGFMAGVGGCATGGCGTGGWKGWVGGRIGQAQMDGPHRTRLSEGGASCRCFFQRVP